MSIFNFFKKKKKVEKKKEPEKKIEKKAETRPLPKAKPVVKKPKKKVSKIAAKTLCFPHVTEKATGLNEENKYVFKVSPRANKIEIREAIKGLYGVDVIDVKIINVPRRKRRLGKQEGWRKGYKKAIVKIKKGQKIEILPR